MQIPLARGPLRPLTTAMYSISRRAGPLIGSSARTSSGSPGVKVCTRKCASFTQPGVIPPAVQFSNTGLAADRTTSRAPQKNEERASERRMCIFFHAATHAALESPLGFYWLQCMSIWEQYRYLAPEWVRMRTTKKKGVCIKTVDFLLFFCTPPAFECLSTLPAYVELLRGGSRSRRVALQRFAGRGSAILWSATERVASQANSHRQRGRSPRAILQRWRRCLRARDAHA